MNCAFVYVERLEEATEEAKTEKEFLESLAERSHADLDNKALVNAAMKSAEVFFDIWIRDDEKYIPAFTENLYFWVAKHVAAAAIFQADEEINHSDATDEVWDEAFFRHYEEQIGSIGSLFVQYMYKEAEDILENDVKPVEMPFEKLRMWAGIGWLEAVAEHGKTSRHTSPVVHKLTDYMGNLLTSRYDLTRPLLDESEGATSTEHRLTFAQIDLMIYTLLGNYDNLEGEHPFIWSPKAYLGRSPNKTEAATLSRRLAVLVNHGLLEKSGREVSVTDDGRALIHAYTEEHKHDVNLLKVRLVLELNETWKNLEGLKIARDVARKRARRDLVRRDRRGPLDNLLSNELKRRDDLIQQLRENAEPTSIKA